MNGILLSFALATASVAAAASPYCIQANVLDAMTAETLPGVTYTVFAANDTLNLAAATVLSSEGETLNAVKTRVYLSMPQGASWTSSTDMLRINGDHATNKSLQDNLAATLTLKLGSLTRTFALNLMKSNSIDGLDTDAKPVAGYEYYRLDGTRTNADDNAPVLLRRTVYTDGTFTVAKIVNRR